MIGSSGRRDWPGLAPASRPLLRMAVSCGAGTPRPRARCLRGRGRCRTSPDRGLALRLNDGSAEITFFVDPDGTVGVLLTQVEMGERMQILLEEFQALPDAA